MGQRGRPKGLPKSGGRQKGSGVASDIRKYMESKDINIIQDFFTDLALVPDPAKRNDQRLRFMDFVYPKPRLQVDLQTISDDLLTIEVKRRVQDEPGNPEDSSSVS